MSDLHSEHDRLLRSHAAVAARKERLLADLADLWHRIREVERAISHEREAAKRCAGDAEVASW